MRIPNLTLAMLCGEPMLVFWRVGDLIEALDASRDMGLPLTSPPHVSDEVVGRILEALLGPDDLLDDD